MQGAHIHGEPPCSNLSLKALSCTHAAQNMTCKTPAQCASGVLLSTGRRSVETHANMHGGGQVPAGTLCATGHRLPWRQLRPQPQHPSRRVLSVAHVPRRGHLLVTHSTFFDRLSRLKNAYVEFYSDAVGACVRVYYIVCRQMCPINSSVHRLQRPLHVDSSLYIVVVAICRVGCTGP